MVNIRRAEAKDVDAIHGLGETVSEFTVNKNTVAFWPKEILAKAVTSKDTIILVAEIDQVMVGFILANLNLSLRKAIIENVYVMPDKRGAGVGAELLGNLTASLGDTEIEYISTLIPLNSQDAPRLYLEAGFSKGETFLWLDKSMSDIFRR